jgi:peptide/nickel transport system permease protein
MKRLSAIPALVIVTLISVAQYRLIVYSVVSFVTWCVMELSYGAPWGSYWKPALLEYWVAGVVWVVSTLGLARAAIWSRQREGRKRAIVGKDSPVLIPWRGVSSRIIGIIGYVALVSPFLMIIDPNVQGSLVKTRLLPPLSVGYVQESLHPFIPGSAATGRAHQLFAEANNFLLRRTVVVRGDFRTDPQIEQQPVGGVIREFPTVFLFGTDDNARDVFSRVISGTRVSLGIGLIAALGALLIGAIVGFAAGISRGIIDTILMRLTDVFLAIPGLLLVIGVLAFVGQSVITIVVVLSVSGWMGIAKVVRGEVLSLREREFILAARLLRVPTWRIITRHLLPNLRPVLLTATVLQFANAVLGEASLGFLGLGVQPPTASWGNMMGEATGYLGSAWWVGVFPGILLAVVLVSAHSLGDRSAADGDPIRS